MGAKPNPLRMFATLSGFAREILATCPYCGKRAIVSVSISKGVHDSNSTKAKCTCNNCYRPINSKQWFGPIILSPEFRRCDYCGTPLNVDKRVNKFESTIKATCSGCEKKRTYLASFTLTFPGAKQATDPYFGLPLWLQAPIDDNIFWAFNHEHLNYLKDYVSATLRKPRVGLQHDLVWELPQYVKDAKNRPRILKLISRLHTK